MFLAGSIGDLVLTLAFIPILYVHCPLHESVGISDCFIQDKVPIVPFESCAYISRTLDWETRLTFIMFSERQKAEGVDTSTMVRLRKFHELNVRTVTNSLS